MSQWHDNNQGSYGNIQESILAQSQKTTNKYYDKALEQTSQFVQGLPIGDHTILYPTVLEDIVKRSNGNLMIISYDQVSKRAVLRKLR